MAGKSNALNLFHLDVSETTWGRDLDKEPKYLPLIGVSESKFVCKYIYNREA